MTVEQVKTSVFLLDDNPADLTRIERMLGDVEGEQFDVHGFDSLASGLAFLETHGACIDVCIVDFSLGSETAFDFLSKLETLTIKDLPSVVMTGQPDVEIDKKLMTSGVYDYWDKDAVNSTSISRSLRYTLAQHRSYLEKVHESKSKTQHLAYINHELKNPLNGLMGYTNILKRIWHANQSLEFDQKNQQRIDACFDGMIRSGETLHTLINDLLNLAEIDLGGKYFTPKPCDFNDIVRRAYELFIPKSESENLTLNLTLPSQDTVVYGDKDKLTQIVVNLVSNALKFTQVGSVNIVVSILNDNGQMSTRLCVDDTGIGMCGEESKSIFKEFYKAHSNRTLLTKKVESTGLGLTITHRLVELHGGEISVESELNKGSTFIVDFPAKKATI